MVHELHVDLLSSILERPGGWICSNSSTFYKLFLYYRYFIKYPLLCLSLSDILVDFDGFYMFSRIFVSKMLQLYRDHRCKLLTVTDVNDRMLMFFILCYNITTVTFITWPVSYHCPLKVFPQDLKSVFHPVSGARLLCFLNHNLRESEAWPDGSSLLHLDDITFRTGCWCYLKCQMD